MTWHAVYTRVHAEARAAENLRRQGYALYLPYRRSWVRHARQRRMVLRPLFPRYLFVWIDRALSPWRPILSTIGVAGVVSDRDGPLPISERVIDLLREREESGVFDVSAPTQGLKTGDRVCITAGPFENMIGRLLEAGDGERVAILFELFGRPVRAEVSAAAVEAA